MRISNEGVNLITKWEGCKLVAYKDGGGVWTIGYGHTSAAGAPPVRAGMRITQDEAIRIFKNDIVKYEDAVTKVLNKTPSQNQFDAMVSLCYNIGPTAFQNSTLVKKFNQGDFIGASKAFMSWVKDNGKVVKGLENRRKSEKSLFDRDNSDTVGTTKKIFNTMQETPKTGLLTAIINIFVSLFTKGKE